jgi:hypothetical protein
MKINPVSEEEKRFVQGYHQQIRRLQNEIGDDYIAYTKISISYAILNELYILSLVFHPLCISNHSSGDKPDLSISQVINTVESILIYELTCPLSNTKLTQQELVQTIRHYRSIEFKR